MMRYAFARLLAATLVSLAVLIGSVVAATAGAAQSTRIIV